MAVEEDKKEGIGLIKDILNQLKKNLEKTNEIFLSEADFQFCFAQELYKLNENKDCKIILEYPIMTKDLYAGDDLCKALFNNEYSANKIENYKEINNYENKKLNCEDLIPLSADKKDKYCKICNDNNKWETNKSFIDLYFEYNNCKYFIEFKYKTEACCAIKRYGKEFKLKPQSAQNKGRYLVYEDIERMEHIKDKTEENCYSFVIFITNDKKYWETEPIDMTGMDKYVPLKREIMAGLHPYHSEKTYRRYIYIHNTYQLGENLKLSNSDNKNGWYDFISIDDNNKFNCLIIDTNEGKPND